MLQPVQYWKYLQLLAISAGKKNAIFFQIVTFQLLKNISTHLTYLRQLEGEAILYYCLILPYLMYYLQVAALAVFYNNLTLLIKTAGK